MALKVLAEKANVLGVDRSDMTAHDKSCACFKASKSEFEKIFTLEFSRDRKSMSVYCKTKDNQPLMFVKVCCIININIAVLVKNCRKLPSRQLVSFISVVSLVPVSTCTKRIVSITKNYMVYMYMSM